MIDQATIEEFKANLRGQLIQPSDEGLRGGLQDLQCHD